jgi:hypothetical protein
MIKKTFEDFILMLEGNSAKQSKLDSEVGESNPESWEKHKEFLHRFHEALEELPSPSWTDIAKSGRRALDSEEAWHDIHSELKVVGLTWEDVKVNKEFILDNIDCYSSLNAYVDIILYNLDDNYNVGGWGVDVESDFDEILVKYRYGYHQTTYGRIFLKRYWGSVENFIEKYAKNILKLFIQETGCIDRADLKDTIEEIDANKGFIYWREGILTVYLEAFYESVKHGIVSAQVHKLDYEKFKAFFMNWLHNANNELEIEDFDDHLEVDFNCDL